jgi:hypothetical protein
MAGVKRFRGAPEKTRRFSSLFAVIAFLLIAAADVAHGQSTVGTNSRWPSVGDRWVYEARDAEHPRMRYQVVVQVQEVTSTSISDVFKPDDGPQIVQTHRAGAFLMSVAPGVANFSPYLGAFQDLHGGESWAAVDFKRLWECDVGLINCNPSARIVGKEKVTVPAGTYDAWKIVVALNPWMGASARGTGELVYWYAEEAKRVVKYQSRVTFQVGGHYSWPQPDIDLELVSYVPAAKR